MLLSRCVVGCSCVVNIIKLCPVESLAEPLILKIFPARETTKNCSLLYFGLLYTESGYFAVSNADPSGSFARGSFFTEIAAMELCEDITQMMINFMDKSTTANEARRRAGSACAESLRASRHPPVRHAAYTHDADKRPPGYRQPPRYSIPRDAGGSTHW